jgi:hypothetical protein
MTKARNLAGAGLELLRCDYRAGTRGSSTVKNDVMPLNEFGFDANSREPQTPPERGTYVLPVAAKRKRKRQAGLTGGDGYCPEWVVMDPTLSIVARFLIAYRLVHIDWSIRRARVRKVVLRGLSRRPFDKAIRELRERRLLDRKQKGRSFTTDTLSLQVGPNDIQVRVEAELFDGTLTPRWVVLILYLRLCSRGRANPWQLRRVLGVSKPTLNEDLAELVEAGWVVNNGTDARPQWGLSKVKKRDIQAGPVDPAKVKKCRVKKRDRILSCFPKQGDKCATDEVRGRITVPAGSAPPRAAVMDEIDRLEVIASGLMARAHREFLAGNAGLGDRLVRAADICRDRRGALFDAHFPARELDGELCDAEDPAHSPSAASWSAAPDSSRSEMGRAA